MSDLDRDDAPLPLVAHLTELRNRLLRCVLAIVIVLLPLMGFSTELYKAWNDGDVVSWISAAWGYSTIRDNAPATAGKWAVAPMPQFTAGDDAAGNWGGSSTAVFSTSKHPAEAAQFALWLNTDPQALTLENKLGDLGNLLATLTNVEWFRSIGESVTIVTGFIFIVCVLALRRGIVGELVALNKKAH